MSRHLARSCARCLPSGLPSQGDTVPCAPLSPNGLTHPPQPCRRREGGMPGPPALSGSGTPPPGGRRALRQAGPGACRPVPPGHRNRAPLPGPAAGRLRPLPGLPLTSRGPRVGGATPAPSLRRQRCPHRRGSSLAGDRFREKPGVPAGSGGRTGRARRRVPRGKRVVPEAALGGAGPAGVRSAGRRVCCCGSAW